MIEAGENMQAAIYYGPGDIRVQERPMPGIGPEEALLRVRAATICGTDLRIFQSGHQKIPAGQSRILGHELAGEIAAVGERVKSLRPGDRVALAPNIGCGVCDQCVQGHNNYCPTYEAFGISLDGAFAEYMLIPGRAIRQGNVVAIPDHLSYEQAALNEPLSCCYHGSLACHIAPGEVVVVIGAGPIGIFHEQLARLSGARLVVMCETSPERLDAALRFGADLGINPLEEDAPAVVRQHTNGQGADVVIVAASSGAAQEMALQMLAYKGRVNLFGGLPAGDKGITFPSNLVHYRQLTVTGTTGSSTYEYRRSLALLAAGRLRVADLISARYGLAQVHQGLEVARSGKALKIVLTP